MIKEKKLFLLLYKVSYISFLYGVGILLTLYHSRGYFGLLDAKADCFVFLLHFLIPLMLLTFAGKILLKRYRKLTILDLSILIFLVCSLISTFFSLSPKEAYYGSKGWYVGFLAIASLIFIHFALKDEDILNHKLFIPVVIVCAFEFIITIADGMGLDLLSFREGMADRDLYIFFATIGNSNWCVGYYSLLIPLFLVLYLNEVEKRKKQILLVITLLGIVASFINGADGIYLAYGFCLFFFSPYLIWRKERIKDFSIVLVFLAISLLIVKYSGLFQERIERLSGYSTLILSDYIIATVFLMAIGMLIYANKMVYEVHDRLRGSLIMLFEGILIISVVCFSIEVIRNATPNWGNGRLALWRFSFDIYNNFTTFRKLIGTGPELLKNYYLPLDIGNGVFVCSHSEPIQTLLTMGLIGFSAWTLCWMMLFISFFKDKTYLDKKRIGIYLGLFAYFAQSFVNSATLLNVCFLSLYLILLCQTKGAE